MRKVSKSSIVTAYIALIAIMTLTWRSDRRADAAAENKAAVSSSEARLWVLRLKPGDDLVDAIMAFARQHSIEAGGIITCVGSLDRARVRFANQSDYTDLNTKGNHFEIVSLVGTLSTTDFHLHLAVANEAGDVFGGHANSGNRVYTTAEIILVEGQQWSFRREVDPVTTYRELSPVPRTAEN